MKIIILTFISFILDFVFNYLFNNTIFIPLFVMSLIVFLEKYFKIKSKYFIYCFIVGFFYDFLYTNVLFLNSSVFLTIGYLTEVINYNFKYNLVSVIIEEIIFVFLYRFFCYSFYYFNGLLMFDFNLLIKSIYSSLIINILFIILIYFSFNKFLEKK